MTAGPACAEGAPTPLRDHLPQDGLQTVREVSTAIHLGDHPRQRADRVGGQELPSRRRDPELDRAAVAQVRLPLDQSLGLECQERRLRTQQFGHLEDLRLGAAIQALIGEGDHGLPAPAGATAAGCDARGRPLPPMERA